MTDAQLEIAYRNRASLSPEERAMVEEAHAELVRRRNAAFAGTPAPVVSQPEPADFPDPVESAAAPITPDPVVAPAPSKRDAYAARMEAAGYTPKEAGMAADYEGTMKGAYELQESDETLRRGAAYMRDQDRRTGQFDANLADAMGHNAGPGMSTEIMPNAGSRPAWAKNAFGGEMINVDGVMVQAYDLGDGQLRYSLGDVKRAKEAQAGAQRDASWRAMIDDDKAKYGDPMLKDDQVTQEQYDNRNARKRAEVREVMQNRALRLHPNRAAFEREVAARRALVARNAMLAGGSQNLNPMMRAQIGAINMANDPNTDPEVARSLRYTLPGGRLAAEVDARQAEMAARLAGNAITAALAGQGQGQQAAELRARARMENGLALAGQAANNAGGLWGGDPRTAADRALRNAGYAAAERAQILDEMFGPGDMPGAPIDAGAEEAPSNAQQFPGQPATPAPRNPLAAPRPYG